MSVRPILRWPDPRLQTPAAPVGPIDDTVRAVWDDMIDTMDAMPGVGLAAPQIGIMRALAVVDASDTRGQAIRMADPDVVWASEDTKPWDEASPCLPGIAAKIIRPDRVRVAFTHQAGVRREQDFVGLWSVSVQHQIDHLAGRLFIDRLSRTKRQMLLKKVQKAKA
ncbi:MAG: peptide deformylase [Pseudomonadota bacterium]